MAITRCPYCHAIIDENDKYCNNCGTQLLFSEDEEIEEEIPGEKIIEADVEEKDYTVDEPGDEKRPVPKKDLDHEIDEELEDELGKETEATSLDELVAAEAAAADEEDVTEEVILVDEAEAAEAKSPDGSAAPVRGEAIELKTPEREDLKNVDEEDADKIEKDEDEEEVADEELAEELEEDIEQENVEEAKPAKDDETREYASTAGRTAARSPVQAPLPSEEPDVEYVSENEPPDETATAGEAGLRPATFDSQELENLGKTVDLSREKIDKFLEDMSAKKVEKGPAPAEPAPETPPEPPTGTLPPWASTMKGAPVFPEDTGPVETRKVRGEPGTPDTEEVEIFPRPRPSDSTMGLPEKVSQAPLPFGRPTGEEEVEVEHEEEEREEEGIVEEEAQNITPEAVVLPGGRVRPAREPILPVRRPEPEGSVRAEAETAAEIEEPAPRPPFSFSVFFKSKTFDILFVGLFWLVALWLAAYSMGITLFGVLGSMSGSMLLLYAVLVLLYFFLFKFFLGETLGDRLFRPRE